MNLGAGPAGARPPSSKEAAGALGSEAERLTVPGPSISGP
jgi:hypothetical protein